MSNIGFSVVICSWNRSKMLVETLESVLSCTSPTRSGLEIVVVDNGSTDDTASRVKPFVDQGRVRYVVERTPGLSNARNAGVDASLGEWVIFLDDDVFVTRDYFVEFERATSAFPEFGFWGGAVVPVFDDETPPWVPSVVEVHPWCFSALDLGTETRELGPTQLPFGANMAVRRELLMVTRFSPNLGYRHGVLIPGEETALFSRLRALGNRGGWMGKIPVQHRLPMQRARVRYVLGRAYGQGRADRLVARSQQRRSLWVLRSAAELTFSLPLALVRGQHAVLPVLIDLARGAGHLSETFRPSTQ